MGLEARIEECVAGETLRAIFIEMAVVVVDTNEISRPRTSLEALPY